MSRRHRGFRRVVGVLVIGAVVASGCQQTPTVEDSNDVGDDTGVSVPESAADNSSEEPEASSNEGTSDDGANRPVPEIIWTPCEGDLECGSVEVPIDYEDPESKSLAIAVVRQRATDADTAKGSIFVNPGGPGASGVNFVRNGFRLDSETSSSYHLVGFDPRGIGGSHPLECTLDRTSDPMPDLSPDTAAEEQALDEEAALLVRQCQATDADLLPHLTTVDVARDLDQLRQAVGDPQLNFYGLSYGTLLAVRYAELFPASTGRLVLDGVVDPERNLSELLAQQAEAFEQGFVQLAMRCENDGPCPPGGLLASFDRVFDRLEESGPIDGVGSTELVMASLLPVYNPSIWTQYREALVEADNGRLDNLNRLSDFLTGSISFTSYAAFACADSDQPEGSNAWSAFATEAAAKAPRFGAVIANELRVCSQWPTSGESVDAGNDGLAASGLSDDLEMLIIGTDGDAATPYENAVSVADQLPGSHLVSVSGQRHTAYNGSQCVRSVVKEYFADRLDLPGHSSCTID